MKKWKKNGSPLAWRELLTKKADDADIKEFQEKLPMYTAWFQKKQEKKTEVTNSNTDEAKVDSAWIRNIYLFLDVVVSIRLYKQY